MDSMNIQKSSPTLILDASDRKPIGQSAVAAAYDSPGIIIEISQVSIS
jgi:hypothetical protein